MSVGLSTTSTGSVYAGPSNVDEHPQSSTAPVDAQEKVSAESVSGASTAVGVGKAAKTFSDRLNSSTDGVSGPSTYPPVPYNPGVKFENTFLGKSPPKADAIRGLDKFLEELQNNSPPVNAKGEIELVQFISPKAFTNSGESVDNPISQIKGIKAKITEQSEINGVQYRVCEFKYNFKGKDINYRLLELAPKLSPGGAVNILKSVELQTTAAVLEHTGFVTVIDNNPDDPPQFKLPAAMISRCGFGRNSAITAYYEEQNRRVKEFLVRDELISMVGASIRQKSQEFPLAVCGSQVDELKNTLPKFIVSHDEFVGYEQVFNNLKKCVGENELQSIYPKLYLIVNNQSSACTSPQVNNGYYSACIEMLVDKDFDVNKDRLRDVSVSRPPSAPPPEVVQHTKDCNVPRMNVRTISDQSIGSSVRRFYVQKNGRNLCGLAAVNSFLQRQFVTPENLFYLLRNQTSPSENDGLSVGFFNENILNRIRDGRIITRAEFCDASSALNVDEQFLRLTGFFPEFRNTETNTEFVTLDETRCALWRLLCTQTLHGDQSSNELLLTFPDLTGILVSNQQGLSIQSVSELLKISGNIVESAKVDSPAFQVTNEFITSLNGAFIVRQLGHFFTVKRVDGAWLRLDSVNVTSSGYHICNDVFAENDQDIINKINNIKNYEDSWLLFASK